MAFEFVSFKGGYVFPRFSPCLGVRRKEREELVTRGHFLSVLFPLSKEGKEKRKEWRTRVLRHGKTLNTTSSIPRSPTASIKNKMSSIECPLALHRQ